MDLNSVIEMEKRLLGGIFWDSAEALPQVAGMLKPEDFYRPEHHKIYKAMLSLHAAGTPCDPSLIEQELKRTGQIVEKNYVRDLAASEYTTHYVGHLAKMVKEKARLRNLAWVGLELKTMANNENMTALEILAETEKRLTAAIGDSYREIISAEDLAQEVYHEITTRREGTAGLPTGYRYIDKLTSGLKKSDLIILAARPSMGKTTLAMNIATNVAKKNTVLIFSLEMSRLQIGQRFFSAESRINAMKIMNNKLTQENYAALVEAAAALSDLKLFVDDSRGITLTEIRMKAQKIKREHGLDLIVIDYLQLIQCGSRYSGNRVQEVSELSRGLKVLAQELNIPILTLSQLSRQTEMRADKKPQLADLRESGSIEQDADIVMFLYRDEYYNKETENTNQAELIIAKNRNGPTTSIQLYFRKEYMRFGSISHAEE